LIGGQTSAGRPVAIGNDQAAGALWISGLIASCSTSVVAEDKGAPIAMFAGRFTLQFDHQSQRLR
jgi:hypothetical protein